MFTATWSHHVQGLPRGSARSKPPLFATLLGVVVLFVVAAGDASAVGESLPPNVSKAEEKFTDDLVRTIHRQLSRLELDSDSFRGFQNVEVRSERDELGLRKIGFSFAADDANAAGIEKPRGVAFLSIERATRSNEEVLADLAKPRPSPRVQRDGRSFEVSYHAPILIGRREWQLHWELICADRAIEVLAYNTINSPLGSLASSRRQSDEFRVAFQRTRERHRDDPPRYVDALKDVVGKYALSLDELMEWLPPVRNERGEAALPRLLPYLNDVHFVYPIDEEFQISGITRWVTEPQDRRLVLVAAPRARRVAKVANDVSSEDLFQQWTKNVKDFDTDVTHPLFKELLQRDDADRWLLSGIHHQRDPVRRMSAVGLASRKTDRAFQELLLGTVDADMFIRERSLNVLADFQQDRCVPVLIRLMNEDTKMQIRIGAARALAKFPERDEVSTALLEVLNQHSEPLAPEAAISLALLQDAHLICPTYELLRGTTDSRSTELTLGALCHLRNKDVMPLLIEQLELLPPRFPAAEFPTMAQRFTDVITSRLTGYARMAEREVQPMPKTPDEWRTWWSTAESLFQPDMQFISRDQRLPIHRIKDFGRDPSDLRLSIGFNAKSYLVGKDIRLQIHFQNASPRHYRVVLPRPPSGWHPTMAYGVFLKRVSEPTLDLINVPPSDFYVGSYSGPPSFESLAAKAQFRHEISLPAWLKHHNIWPLAPGRYEFRLEFEPRQYPGIKAQGVRILGHWKSEPVTFTVEADQKQD